jgi:pyruvate,water dikinase
MQWWVIDLDGGFRKEIEGNTVSLEDITSVPMLALWEGVTAIPWEGPPPIDTRGFLSVMYEATMDSSLVPGMGSRFAERNYFIISRNFCHLSSRFGFHFSTVEAFLSDSVAENYICFNFKGGAADHTRKKRRANLIKTLLEKFDFWVQVKGDLIFARLERQEQDLLKQRLKILGYLTIHTRQLDMILSDSGRVNWYVQEMLKQISSFAAIPE